MAEKIELTANQRIHLGEEQSLFVLEEGSINLFAIEHRDGPRTLLATFEAPATLFPISPIQDLEVVAISECPSILSKQPLDSPTPSHLHGWIYALSKGAHTLADHTQFLESPGHYILDANTAISAKKGTSLYEREHLCWTTVKSGELEIFGRHPLLPSDTPYPIPATHFASTQEETEVETYTTEQVIRAGKWQEGLALFHKVLLEEFLSQKNKKATDETRRFEEKNDLELQTLHNALGEMGSLLNPKEFEAHITSANPLFQACQQIGKFIGCEFTLPKEMEEEGDLSTQLTLICDESQLRNRQVRLASDFWKRDTGPLLAFYGEEMIPVALVNEKPTRYEMVHPSTGERVPVTAKIAHELAPIAYIFYPPFPKDLSTAKELFHFFMKRHWKEFLPLIFYGIIGALVSLLPPIATAWIFNKAIPYADPSMLTQIAIALVLAALSAASFFFFRSLLTARIEGLAGHQIQMSFWDRLLKLPVSFFRKYSSGNLVLRVLAIEQMRPLLSDNATRVLFTGTFALFYIIAMAIYSPLLTLAGIVMVLFGLIVTSTCAILVTRYQRKILELQGSLNGLLIQIISGVGKLRVAGAENNAFSFWATQFAKRKKLEMKSQNIQNIVTVVNSMMPLFTSTIVFALVMYLRTASEISVGSFLAFNSAFTTFSLTTFQLTVTLMTLAPVLPLWERSKVILEEPIETPENKVKPGKLSGSINIDQVIFAYDEHDPLVLDHVSLTVNPKEFIAIVGPSGCGKSTLVRLLLGFDTPQSGAVYYDDKDLTSLNIGDIRKQMGVVLQGGGITAGTIHDNLSCGAFYTKEEIERAIALSGFDQDLESFPMGMHTVIPMDGGTLSGGQKQRLLIARALLPNPNILIFDEATSALDNHTQDRISHNIESLDVTRIVIAHRLSTIKHADRIYVLDGGRIIQSGTFDHLASQEGLFQSMLARQKL